MGEPLSYVLPLEQVANSKQNLFLYGRVSYVTLLYPFPASQAIRVSRNDISTTLIVSFVLSFTQSLMNGISYYLTKVLTATNSVQELEVTFE